MTLVEIYKAVARANLEELMARIQTESDLAEFNKEVDEVIQEAQGQKSPELPRLDTMLRIKETVNQQFFREKRKRSN